MSYNKDDNEQKIFLREEQLGISKEKIKTAEVTVHKEFIKEHKTITVPVTREEIVIEKKIVDSNTLQEKHIETIRIPIKEESVEVTKRPVVLGEVSIYQEEIHSIKKIKDMIQKEKIHLDVSGQAEVINRIE